MMARQFFLFCLFCLFSSLYWPSQICGQDLAYWQLTDDDGLPDMTVYSILQDSTGFIWLGTANGICRYDGSEIINIPKNNLKDGEILFIEKDKYNHIWFKNLSGQLGFVKNNKIILIEEEIDNQSILEFKILGEYIYTIQQSINAKKVFIKRYKINPNGQLVSTFRFKKEFIKLSSSFREKGENLVFTAYYSEIPLNKMFEISAGSDEIKTTNNYPNINGYLLFSSSEVDLIYNRNPFILSSRKKNKIEEIFKTNIDHEINKAEVINGKYYILTRNGILLGLQESQLSNKNMLLKDIFCNTLFIDEEKNHWVGTTGNGVIVIPSPPLTTYTTINSTLPNNEIYAIYPNHQTILLGQNGGFLSILTENKKISFKKLNGSGRITAIHQDEDKDYWIATDSYAEILTQDLQVKNDIRLNLKSTFQDRQQNLWLGKSDGISKIDKINIPAVKKNRNILETTISKNLRTYALNEDYEGKIWIGTSSGLFYYTDTIYPFIENEMQYNSSISDIELSKDSTIWVSTLGDGVIAIKEGKINTRFNISNGLSSNICKKIHTENNQIWIATDAGLNILNTKTKNIEYINKTDGLLTNNINEIQIQNDQVWVGTSKGLINFPKNINTQNNFPPPVHINAIKIWDKDTLLTKNMSLLHDQNNLQIEFLGLSFKARGDLSYKYKLTGVDKDWVKTTSKFVRYPQLDPGKYNFRVLAINEDGIVSETPAVFQFAIKSPWWQTWWFRVLALLAVAGLISTFFYLRLQRAKTEASKEAAFKEKVNELKQQALQTQMNPHFIFNSLNAIQQFITTNEPEQAMQYLASFARLVRMIFEQSKSKDISFDEEIDFIKLYLSLENLRFYAKVNTEIIVDPAVQQEAYRIKIPPLLLQPLIENSFKHGLFHKPTKGSLQINFSRKNNFLVCQIRDDGVGREAAKTLGNWKDKNHKSSGIKTARERLVIINGSEKEKSEDLRILDLFDNQGRASGTQVIVKIKCIPN